MVDLNSGICIYKKNEHEKQDPASLVKIMTAILVLENIKDLKNTQITAPRVIFDELWKFNASTSGTLPEERLNALDLLYCLMLPSSCEVASMFAYFLGKGDSSKFVSLANDKAKILGALDTHIENAHGLYHECQQSTPYDMYLLAKHALKFKILKDILSIPAYKIKDTNKRRAFTIFSTNDMLKSSNKYYYPPVKGGKTGTQDNGNKNLLTYAVKDDSAYLIVIMGAKVTESENFAFKYTKDLYNWAFDTFYVENLVNTEQVIADVSVKYSFKKKFLNLLPSENFKCALPKDSKLGCYKLKVDAPAYVNTPVKKGDKIGKVNIMIFDKLVKCIDLVAFEDIERNNVAFICDKLKNIFQIFIIRIILICIFIIFMFYLIWRSNRKRSCKLRKNEKKVKKMYFN
jgi:D-alanyl-D-alanine carboxypeptidase (penicillin-binding protein 5/6)